MTAKEFFYTLLLSFVMIGTVFYIDYLGTGKHETYREEATHKNVKLDDRVPVESGITLN